MESGLVASLGAAGLSRGGLVALAVGPAGDTGLATGGSSWWRPGPPARAVLAIEAAYRPRWVMWSGETALALARSGVRVAVAWDLAAVHRLLHGGWRADPAGVWAASMALDPGRVPAPGPMDLFSDGPGAGSDGGPVRHDGYLDPDWVAGAWHADPAHLEAWAALALRVAAAQHRQLAPAGAAPSAVPVRATATARIESAVELLCAEMTVDGLPVDRGIAERIIAGIIGPRPHDRAGEAAQRDRRDRPVLAQVPAGVTVDLRSSAQVKTLLSRLGVEVADTRAWRLRAVQDRHPFVPAFLAWRKAERMATTYGYEWLDSRIAGGRLRGTWTGADGAAGRMAASGGLHNMPAELRAAVVADEGHLFVRADLGQVEPRVLAVVSGDPALCRAAAVDDLYAPVAEALAVDRATAKVAVLGAMYGQTTGHGAQALRRLDRSFPEAMAYLDRAARAAEAGEDLRTFGGRLVPMAAGPSESPAQRAARGRYGRNAMVQGAAAELFKAWAVTVRARGAPLGATIVLCLHDELLVQVPSERAAAAAGAVADSLREAVHRWAPGTPVRFVAEVSVIRSWAEAKEAGGPEAGGPEPDDP